MSSPEDRPRAGPREILARFLETTPDAMVVVDERGRIALVNHQTESLFGYAREELLGEPIEVLIPERLRFRHASHRESYSKDLRVRPMGMGLELFGRKRDGTEFPVEISLSPIHTEDGVLVSAAIRDTTERQRVEAALKESAYALRAQVDELERFAHSLAHDLREPLRGVAALATQIEDSLPRAQRARLHEPIELLRASVARMGDLIEGTLRYARAGWRASPTVALHADDALDRALVNLKVALSESGATIRRDPLPEVRADPELLPLVFQNLIGNAVKFRSRDPPEVRIGASESNGHWRFHVVDNGVGIPPDAHDLFEPFRRGPHAEGIPGAGVGLAICQRIVQRHGGRIWHEPAPGRGTVFYFTIPRA